MVWRRVTSFLSGWLKMAGAMSVSFREGKRILWHWLSNKHDSSTHFLRVSDRNLLPWDPGAMGRNGLQTCLTPLSQTLEKRIVLKKQKKGSLLSLVTFICLYKHRILWYIPITYVYIQYNYITIYILIYFNTYGTSIEHQDLGLGALTRSSTPKGPWSCLLGRHEDSLGWLHRH